MAGASAADGMIRPSFIPPPEIRNLRSLTRQRRDLIGAGARERNRVQRLLEEANIKLGNVLSDVFGVSGQRMLEALLEGKAEASEVAQLAVASACAGKYRLWSPRSKDIVSPTRYVF